MTSARLILTLGEMLGMMCEVFRQRHDAVLCEILVRGVKVCNGKGAMTLMDVFTIDWGVYRGWVSI